MQHVERMRFVIFSFLACLALPYLYTLYHKRHDFREGGGMLLNVKYVLIFLYKFCLKYFSFEEIIARDIIVIVCRTFQDVPVFLARF